MVLILLFVCFPIMGLPIYTMFYFFNKNTKGILYSLLMGLTLGLIAYYFIPPTDYDLYRHHLVVTQISDLNLSQALSIYEKFNLEILPFLYSYIISIFNNIDLLQFFIVSMGYSILFYILYDYRKKNGMNNLNFVVVFLFTIFGFHALYFISGLYCYIGIIIFAFAFYNEYVKDGNKILSYILYILTLLIHNAMFFPFALLIIYKFFKNKVNLKSLAVCLAVIIFVVYILSYLSSVLNVGFINSIASMYERYINRNDYMKKFYSGTVFFIEITKIIMTILCIILQKKRKITDGINGFIILLTLWTMIMLPRSIVMIRFAMLIQFLGIIPMMDYLKPNPDQKNKNKVFVYFILATLSIIYIAYFFRLFIFENFGNFFDEKIYRDIFTVLRK